MSAIYTQEKASPSTNLSALAIGILSATAIFAILPMLMKIPNPFDATEFTRPEPAAEKPPIAFKFDETPFEPESLEIEKPEIEVIPPPMTLTMLESLINLNGKGIGVAIDAGRSFLKPEDTTSDLFELTDLDKHPRVIVAAKPVYPYQMKVTKMQGSVMVEFVIERDGNVSRPRVFESSHRDFEQAAISAILKSKWQPGQKNGEAVRSRVRLPVNFQL